MCRPYSDDLRARVAASVVAGRTCRASADLFGVSIASAVKWSQRLRKTGSAAAKAMGGVRRSVLAGERDWLLSRIETVPDLTLRALAADLAERGIVVSHWAVWKFCKDEQLTFNRLLKIGWFRAVFGVFWRLGRLPHGDFCCFLLF